MTVRSSRKLTLGRICVYAFLVIAALYFLMPIYILLVTALKGFDEVNINYMWWPPQNPTLEGFVRAWFGGTIGTGKPTGTGHTIGKGFENSLWITIPASIISSFMGSINGYIFAKWKFRGSNLIFLLFLFGMFLPYQGVLIPMVQLLTAIPAPTASGTLYGSVLGLIFVHCIFGIPICALMFRSYYSGVPDELLDAAKIDGCGFFNIYLRILLPLAAPAFAVVLLWQFTSIWNDFIIGLIILNNPATAPVMVSVQNLAGSLFTEWNVQMAGALVAALPTIVVYLLLGRLFMRGLLAGSIKG